MFKIMRLHHSSPNSIYGTLWVILLLLLLAACSIDSGEPDLVSENGIRVDENFEERYLAWGGEDTLGEAITSAYSPEENGRFTQYFERMRLDRVGSEITPYPLGLWAYEGVNEAAIVPSAIPENGRLRTFENGETVYDAFLTFYENNSGERLLGTPISPQFQEGGVWTQYFENGRLEWHPELPVGQRVQLGLLGQAHFDGEMAATYQPTNNFILGPSAGISHVILNVAVSAPILYSDDEQTIFVSVLSSDRTASVADIRLQARLVGKNGRTLRTIDLPRSDGNGRSQLQLDLPPLSPGQDFELRVDALNGSGTPIGTTSLMFKTWW